VPVKPIVRYMILCDDWEADEDNELRLNIRGLLINIQPLELPPYPLYRDICVVLALTEGRGSGEAKIRAVFEETGETIFETPDRTVSFGTDPLEIKGVTFRILHCPFPRAGVYSIQFLYNGGVVEERPLRLR
jgi:hypothetical protein